MNLLIGILHLEDDPKDMELVKAKLDEVGLNFRITSVQARDAFEEATNKRATVKTLTTKTYMGCIWLQP